MIYIKAAILLAAFFASCSSKYSSDELVDLEQARDSLSVESAENITSVYTDSAMLKAKIRAVSMKRYPTAEDPYVVMPDGVEAEFYGPRGEIQSTLSAKYAINYEEKEQIIMRDSVRVVNYKDEEIKTDELIWNKKERRIYSDKPVRIRVRNEKILIGEGFESNETFTAYSIKKQTGTIRITEETENEQSKPTD